MPTRTPTPAAPLPPPRAFITAQDDCARLEGELRDYKARAHALLKAKEGELKAARDIVR